MPRSEEGSGQEEGLFIAESLHGWVSGGGVRGCEKSQDEVTPLSLGSPLPDACFIVVAGFTSSGDCPLMLDIVSPSPEEFIATHLPPSPSFELLCVELATYPAPVAVP
ncbi:hypothetical protein B296_00010311 [Ensete ventricosum]|uniref:Uncharacterized protein n=1 Tax=Ensete ventricosum TaxID=4639 RepID=A0A427B7Y1_ENSVE|nr:hypothetical protein B296_00010311 [Ensete ventricosum]